MATPLPHLIQGARPEYGATTATVCKKTIVVCGVTGRRDAYPNAPLCRNCLSAEDAAGFPVAWIVSEVGYVPLRR